MSMFRGSRAAGGRRTAGSSTGLSRRAFVGGAAAGTLAVVQPNPLTRWVAALGSAATPAGAAAGAGDLPVSTGRLLQVFLRGGMDGLSAVVPLLDGAAYRAARPSIAVAESATLALDGRFGLHPGLAPLHELYWQGELAVVHAVGNGTDTRSHFSAQAQVELGGVGLARGAGWISRLLAGTRSPQDAVVRAVALSAVTPLSLLGQSGAVATASLDSFGLGGQSKLLAVHGDALAALYAPTIPSGIEGGKALAAVSALAGLAGGGASATGAGAGTSAGAGAAELGATSLAAQLADAATLFTADLGVEVVTVDAGGWDLHNELGGADAGAMRSLLDELAGALATFWDRLHGAGVGDVTVVVVSEFGRRVAENGSGGVDHGRANALFVLGAGLAGGGHTIAEWPGLGADALDQGDLRSTVDYRSILAEIAARRFGHPDPAALFPGATLAPVGVA